MCGAALVWCRCIAYCSCTALRACSQSWHLQPFNNAVVQLETSTSQMISSLPHTPAIAALDISTLSSLTCSPWERHDTHTHTLRLYGQRADMNQHLHASQHHLLYLNSRVITLQRTRKKRMHCNWSCTTSSCKHRLRALTAHSMSTLPTRLHSL